LTDPNNLFQKLIFEFVDNSIEAHKSLAKRHHTMNRNQRDKMENLDKKFG
jgi:hypothetical protein